MKSARPVLLKIVLVLSIAPCCSTLRPAAADDWPTWRHDANRSGATAEQLPAALHLNWTRSFHKLTPAWPEDARLQFDASYEPIVVGSTMFVGSSRNDSVTALDLGTGETKWRFYADGPVRFAPVAANGKLYFGSDDGRFYCLNAADGSEVWRFQAAPSNRKVIGNARLISVWPMRGGPVLADGKIYFTVGVWPFEGTFLYTLDAETGRVADSKTLDGDSIAPPKYSVTTLKDMTPQGYLAAVDSRLFIPQGRASVGCLDRKTNKFLKYSYSTSRVTSYHVAVSGRWLFHGVLGYDTRSKTTLPFQAKSPVLTDDTVFVGTGDAVIAYDLTQTKIVESKDRRGRVTKRITLPQRWTLPGKAISELPELSKEDLAKWLKDNPFQIDLKAGNRIYGHRGNTVFSIDLPAGDKKAAVSWKTQVAGTPTTMLAANGRLCIVTDTGRFYCYSANKTQTEEHPVGKPVQIAGNSPWSKRVAAIVKQQETPHGYALLLGVGTESLLNELLLQTDMQVIAIDPDSKKVDALRQRLYEDSRYGTRVVALVGDPLELRLPAYMANLIVSEDPKAAGIANGDAFTKSVFHSLRPYGGSAYLPLDSKQHDAFAKSVLDSKLSRAEVGRNGGLSQLTRAGALAGAADWTHEYGDPSNTLTSQDQLVKAPLGVLWFGGPASDGSLFYNRHFWGPSMAVIGGRMFIQGPGKLTAVDVYTGRILWQDKLEDKTSYRSGRRGNDFEKVLAGFHYLAVEDGIYLVDGQRIVRYHPATGKQMSVFKTANPDDDWGRIRVVDDLLIAIVFRELAGKGKQPVEIVAMNRNSGKIAWSKKAELTFPIISISGDKVFCYDGALESFYTDWKRRGLLPKAADIRYLKALDLKTGKELWKYTTDMIGTWMGYSGKRDVLMVSNKKGMTAFRGKDGSELWKKYSEGQGFRGHPESYWDRVIVWNDWVIDQRGPGAAYSLETGLPIMRRHPITNKDVAWKFTKSGHHCNYAIASPHLLTFRAASAGFCDIGSGTTGRLDGFRSGCRNSLIPADGVLNAPNFAHGCVCGYSLFTSLALTHLPETELWSYSPITLQAKTQRVEQLGVNFGAPGDRLASNGTFWLDYPNVGGASPAASIKVTATAPRYFRKHSSFIQNGDLKWVAASGVEGATAVNIGLAEGAKTNRGYTVRLTFAEPDGIEVGERVFGVTLQGKKVLTDFDVSNEADGRNRSIVKEFKGVQAAAGLAITLTPKVGKPILSGVEIIAE